MKCDFSGYATKNDLVCGDGRIIRHDAFKDCDGKRVPLVWQHIHDDPTNVLGHMILENRSDGIYAYGFFNDTEKAQVSKSLVKHGDVNSMSIYANQLKQQGCNVLHGNIREVSLVLAGANPGATIENISFAHADGSVTDSEDDILIHMDGADGFLEHADSSETSSDANTEETNDTPKAQNGNEPTVEEIWNTFTEEQKNMVYAVVAAETGGADPEEVKQYAGKLADSDSEVKHADDSEDISDSDEETEGKTVAEIYETLTEDQKTVANYIVGYLIQEYNKNAGDSTEEEDSSMKHNAFDGIENVDEEVISHDDLNAALNDSLHSNSMRETFLSHGIKNIEVLFPEAQTVSPTPEMINITPTEWVDKVWNGVHKSPFSRIKSTAADLTADEARAKGYVKGKKKIEEQISMLYRKTTPQTIYKKQKLDRDDILDITDFDVVAWLKLEMRQKLNEELCRAILVGDGREASAEDRINPENIRPIYQDSDVYTIHHQIAYTPDMKADDKSALLVDSAVIARANYRGSGSPVLFASNEILTQMILARDKMGRRLYKDEAELASALRVSAIVETPVLKGVTRKAENELHQMKTYNLLGLIVNLKDYTVGADKGGAVSFFDDFDIDYNQQKYLIETRCSGALTMPYSAIALETTAD